LDDAFVIQTNIDRYRGLLATCTDEALRRTLEKLLAEATHQLKRLTEQAPKGHAAPAHRWTEHNPVPDILSETPPSDES
jgi:hypothetical protein